MSGNYDPRSTCQVCREQFTTKLDRDVHVSTAHDLRRGGKDRTSRFLACRTAGCSERVFVGHVCPSCGKMMTVPTWAS